MPPLIPDNRSETAQSEAAASPMPQLPRRYILAGALIIAGATLLAYYPALGGGFIWDDETYVINSSVVTGGEGMGPIWFSTHQQEYYPISYSTFWFEWRLWGMNPLGYHIINLALHIAVALLIWTLLRKLAIPGAFLAALLFAVHPVNVESVTWIFQRRGLLATFFSLLSILCYLRACQKPESAKQNNSNAFPARGRWYWLSLALFIVAMLSKGSVAILPLILLLMIWWQRRRIISADWMRTLPFFLVAAALTAVNIWFQTHGSGEAIRSINNAQRFAGAGAALWFYVSKALLPIELIFVYPQWNIQIADIRWWLPLLTGVLFTAILWRRCHSTPSAWIRSLLFAWGIVCVALLPVLGFTDTFFMKYSSVADHYQYIALIAIVASIAAAWSAWYRWSGNAGRAAAATAATIVVITLIVLTFQQGKNYADVETLYAITIQKNPTCWMAHVNLGEKLAKAGRTQEAIEHYREALKINPDDALAYNNLGNALVTLGLREDAIEQFRQALKLQPNDVLAHYNLGNVLLSGGQTQEAIEHFQQAVTLRPTYAAAHTNLATALANAGRTTEAIDHYRQAVKLKSNSPEALVNLGLALQKAGSLLEAIDYYRQALKLRPTYAEAHNDLGMALLDDRPEEALEQFQLAVEINPNYTEACVNLAEAFDRLNRPSEAIAVAQMALELARTRKQADLVRQIETWLATHRRGQAQNQHSAPRSELIPKTP